eukprot:XP_011663103.1 PREDICTED: uncharacterized protein LOC105437790 [Strongylocentrotus purpuratus]
MDLVDLDPLSARSTSSVEDGASSTRSKKSKTLARLRKLKKTNNSLSDPSKDVLVPHPPDSQQRDGLSDRRLSNGFVNGGSALSDDLTQSTKTGRDRVNDIITGDDRGKVTGLDPLPSSNRLDWGEKSTLNSSLFSSPLDPMKPTRRGLGGLESLAPRAVLEPLEKPKTKSQMKPEENIDRVGIRTNGISENGIFEVEEAAKETYDTPSQRGTALRIDGVVETETSDSQHFGSFPDRNSIQENDVVSLSSVEKHLPSETNLETKSHAHEREQIKDVLSKSGDMLGDDDGDALDILPDDGESSDLRSDVVVSSAMKERTNISSTFSDMTNTRTLAAENNDRTLNSRFQNSLGSEAQDVLQEQQTKPKMSVTLIEDDDDDDDESDDDELIVVSPLKNSFEARASNVPPKSEDNLKGNDLDEEEEKEIELPNRTVLGDEDEILKDDDKEDEEKLKQYLKDKLQHIEDDEDSDALRAASPTDSLRAGRLSPITNASAPPPLPSTVMSPSLRTSYKRDDDLEDSFGNSEMSVLSGGSMSETNRSMASSSLLLNKLTNKSARKGNRSYLSGGVRNSGSLLGNDELDSHLPERRLRIFVATWNMHEDKKERCETNGGMAIGGVYVSSPNPHSCDDGLHGSHLHSTLADCLPQRENCHPSSRT